MLTSKGHILYVVEILQSRPKKKVVHYFNVLAVCHTLTFTQVHLDLSESFHRKELASVNQSSCWYDCEDNHSKNDRKDEYFSLGRLYIPVVLICAIDDVFLVQFCPTQIDFVKEEDQSDHIQRKYDNE